MRRPLFILVALIVLLTPAVAAAADWVPLVKCGGTNQSPCTPCSIFETVSNIFDLILKGITGPIAAFMIVMAGGMMLLGGGNPSLYGKGVTMLRQTLIGVSVILLAWIVTNFLIKALIQGNQGDAWYEFSCPVELQAIKPIATATPTGGQLSALPQATIIVPMNVGVAAVGGYGGALDSGMSGSGTSCQLGTCPAQAQCPKLRPLLSKYSGNAKLLESIMFHESSCLIKPRSSGAGAYGLMQIQPDTANANREGCDVVDADGNPVQITAAWLTSEQNLEKIVCVANNVVNALRGACGNSPLNIAAGYNGGSGVCAPSQDCKEMPSCVEGRPTQLWECPWDNPEHTSANTGYIETRNYAPKVAACAQ